MSSNGFDNVQSIRDFKSLLRYLRRELRWPIDEETPASELTFDYSPAELGLDEQQAKFRAIRQLRPLTPNQPWGIFLLETSTPRGYTAELRRILRTFAPKARARFSDRPHWKPENLLFLITCDYRQFTFAHFKVDARNPSQSKLAAFGWDENTSGLRTLCEFNLPPLAWPANPADAASWLAQWASAFDVEKVTRAFFRDYRALFEQAEASIDLPWGAEQKRLYTQRFFNRLLFLAFLERKGWLTFRGRKDYLRALFDDYYHNDPERRRSANFHRKRLNALFFMGLNNPYGRGLVQEDPHFSPIRALIGEVPYLNGGLFEREADDETFFFSDDLLARILSGLLYRYNFTVTESTPLDVEVAVDPEMLGKIFEELVTGRHESGSYYTPKPVVQFMCREALKGCLEAALPAEDADSIARFVDENDGAALRDPEAALAALKQVKVCDPACGSGAYLLGMLHELLEKREALFAARRLDAQTIYARKLEIIQNNLYGVDLDPFAVNIARLRLWLSLIVDYEGYPPPPLPNLDFKIETGDSLLGPDPSGGLQPDLFRYGQVQQFLRLKNEYMSTHAGSDEKKKLAAQIEALKADIQAWAHTRQAADLPNAFDWQVEFAEVFAPSRPADTLPQIPKEFGGGQGGGFDILLANPPYVRQELIKDLKPALRRVYGALYTGTADLYVYFYLRAHQLLKPGGVMVFISSNKYFRSAYGETLRAFLGKHTRLRYLIDFGDSPVFQAIAYPSILVAHKAAPGENQFKALSWKSDAPLEQFDEARRSQTFLMPQSDLTADGWRLEDRATLRLLEKLRRAGTPLGDYVKGRLYRGIITGLNEAFVVERATRDRLIAEHPSSAEVLKPFLRGRDIKRWRVEYAETYLIKIESSDNVHHPWSGKPVHEAEQIFVQTYPAIAAHFAPFRADLIKRQDQGKYFWELRSCAYWQEFEKPKIVWGNLTTQSNFSFAESGFYISAPANLVVSSSSYLLGILNSKIAEFWVSQSGAQRQGGFLEYKPMYVSPIPIPPQPVNEQISALVTRILEARRADPSAEVRAWEREIDRLVYALYGLTEEEIAIVEGRA
ncbi:MAG: TaqI-like C-terminal specificity domain-containing protein [Anaerolineales bacterium]|nr:TaqI-like C-terminal specificity domain-containing protein [Anaerolineales bacterium]